jgi:hypothetical protein
MRRRALWLALASALGAAACADVWGMKDLTVEVDGGVDATSTPPDDANDEAAAVTDAEETDAASLEAGDAMADGPSSEAGDGAIDDGGDAAAMVAACLTSCTSGCCDTGGKCQKGTSVSACGSPGHVCAVCNASCLPTQSNCCNSSLVCTCALLCL